MSGLAGSDRQWQLALAAGVLVLAVAGPLAAQSGRVAWGPTREAAVTEDQTEVVGSGVVQAETYEELPGRPMRVQRPARLMPRSSASRMQETYVEGPAVEDLPVPGTSHLQHHGMSDCGACCGHGCVDCCGQWNSCGPVSPCCLLPRPCLDPLEVQAGVQGFTGPLNRGASGSFGFYEGFNYAIPICGDCFCGQLGARWTQSNFDGSFITPEDRTQVFLTTGLFRRADWGLQWGLVFDYLNDQWDYEVDLAQLRGEVGWRFEACHEIGFRFSSGIEEDQAEINEPVLTTAGDGLTLESRLADFEVNDLFVFYYRRQFACGGEGRLFGGFTGESQGVFGGDVRLPMNACWSLAADFLYVVPSEDSDQLGFVEETWNVSVGVVWTPFARPGCPTYCRPLFDVANNGTFATLLR
jgi:hypothetical protein